MRLTVERVGPVQAQQNAGSVAFAGKHEAIFNEVWPESSSGKRPNVAFHLDTPRAGLCCESLRPSELIDAIIPNRTDLPYCLARQLPSISWITPVAAFIATVLQPEGRRSDPPRPLQNTPRFKLIRLPLLTWCLLILAHLTVILRPSSSARTTSIQIQVLSRGRARLPIFGIIGSNSRSWRGRHNCVPSFRTTVPGEHPACVVSPRLRWPTCSIPTYSAS